jgi:RNA polymerase sigma factor (TIGR02999 family)
VVLPSQRLFAEPIEDWSSRVFEPNSNPVGEPSAEGDVDRRQTTVYLQRLMNDAAQVTQILNSIEHGAPQAAERLLPLLYDELRRLAAHKLKHEPAGQTLEATALVHEAYLRLVDGRHQQNWNSRGHFFGAAAEAMRRILVESARRKRSERRGGDLARRELDESAIAAPEADDELLALDQALERLMQVDAQAAELVKLRFFSGLSVAQAGEVLGVSIRTAERLWTYAKAWLYRETRSPA